MIASSPSTPVNAQASGSVPLYEVPVIPTLPVDQYASTFSSPVGFLKPLARRFSQSTTAFGASVSFAPPTLGQPCDRPVPGDSEGTTAKPRGTQSATSSSEMRGLLLWNGIGGACSRGWGLPCTSWCGSQKYFGSVDETPEK